MASAADSGVDTGNDSSDSSIQEKLSKMDIGLTSGIFQLIKPSESSKETSSEEEQDNNNPTIASFPMADSNSNMTHLQPTSLMHGYEYPSISPAELGARARRLRHCLERGIFVSGGPLGTHYQENDMVTKLSSLRMTRPNGLSTGRREHWSRSAGSIANYIRMKDTLRMCRAACHNNTQAMREMLQSGVSPNCQDRYKRSPLHLAACMGYTDMVKLLLEYGADPNAKDSIGNTPLHLVACTNHINVITLLLKAGTRVSEKDKLGHSPLKLAMTKFKIMKRSVMPHPMLKEQIIQVINLLSEDMKRKESPGIDPEMLKKFETMVRVSDSTEQVENNLQDLLSSLTLSSSSQS